MASSECLNGGLFNLMFVIYDVFFFAKVSNKIKDARELFMFVLNNINLNHQYYN